MSKVWQGQAPEVSDDVRLPDAFDTPAARDVLAERARQKASEGFSPMGDDRYRMRELGSRHLWRDTVPSQWPWDRAWWKPKDRRRDLVRAAALILAEIERLNRAGAKAGVGQGEPG